MPGPTSATEFFAVLEKSGVADPAALRSALADIKSNDEPAAIAQKLVALNIITAFHAEQLLAGRFKGFRLGQYKILSVLGAGGMGRVYLAEHAFMRRRVALKVLPKSHGPDSSAVERFQREAMAVAALNHRNIVQAYDSGMEGEVYFLAMEWVQGVSLQEFVKKFGPAPWAYAADFIRQAAVGLHHAHLAGLIHRDVKPGNLLVDATGVIKILDLGLAMFFSEQVEGDPLTVRYSENVLGTADYLAPEQAIDSHSVDSRADIYSLGCTLYYLLSGQAPFPTGTITQKLLAHQQREPQRIETLVADLPPDLAAALRKMMAKDPANRFANYSEIVAAMRPHAKPMPAPLQSAPRPTGVTSPETSVISRPSPPKPIAAARSRAVDSADINFDFIRSADTQTSGAGLTSPPSVKRSGSVTTVVPTRKDSSSPWVWVLVGLGATALIVVMTMAAMNRPNRPSSLETVTIIKKASPKPMKEEAAPTADPTDIAVKADLNWTGARNIADAFAAVTERRRIVLSAKFSGDWDSEPIKIGPGGFANRHFVQLTGEKPGLIVTTPSEGRPFLTIQRTRGFSVTDLVIDGGGQAGPLILVEGDGVEGFRIENVTFRNYTGPALSFAAARGTVASPIQLKNLRFEPASDKGVGVSVAPSSMDPSPTRELVVADCRFMGCTSGIEIAGPLATASVVGCVFANSQTGLHFQPGPANSLLSKLTLDGCTFWKCQSGVFFRDAVLEGADVRVSRSLFVELISAPVVSPVAAGEASAGRIRVEHCVQDREAGAAPAEFRGVGVSAVASGLKFESTAPDQPKFMTPSAHPALRKDSGDRGFIGAIEPAK